MPTEVNRSRGPASRRGASAPTSLVPLALIAVLILILHVAGSTVLAGPHAHASAASTEVHLECPDETLPQPSLPFD
jgi:hypothetical protein